MCVYESLEVTHCVLVSSSWGTLGSQIEANGKKLEYGASERSHRNPLTRRKLVHQALCRVRGQSESSFS